MWYTEMSFIIKRFRRAVAEKPGTLGIERKKRKINKTWNETVGAHILTCNLEDDSIDTHH